MENVIKSVVFHIAEQNKDLLTTTTYHELRNTEYDRLVRNHWIDDTDENYELFDRLLASKLNVNWD